MKTATQKQIIATGFDYNQRVEYCGGNRWYVGQTGRIEDFGVSSDSDKVTAIRVIWDDPENSPTSAVNPKHLKQLKHE